MLAHTIPFSPDGDESFFQEIPAAPAVFLLRGQGEPYVSKTANLRRRLLRLLGRPIEQSKRLNLRERVQEIEFTCTGSDFESNFLLYRLLRENFPGTYAKRLRLRPASLVKLHLENEYARASVTTSLRGAIPNTSSNFARPDSRGRLSPRNSNFYYGPFPSRAVAEKFANDALDFFKMRRCVEDLRPDPAFPGCVYSEMKMCLAPCFKGCTDDEYRAEVGRVQNFFDTGGGSFVRELSAQRERASAELAFEEAAAIHTKIEKLKPVVMQLPEIVRRLDRLQAIVVQPSPETGTVRLFRFCDMQIAGPVLFQIEQRGEVTASTEPGTHAPGKPRAMESRVDEAIQSFLLPATVSVTEQMEHLAIFKRWYYRSSRVGEVFFADDNGNWPLRRVVRGIGRVFNGERVQPPPSFSATEPAPPPSQAI